MDKMIQKLVQKTLERYNEALDTFSSFDRDSIPVELRTECYIAQRPTDNAMFELLGMMAYSTFEENTALVAKYLEDLENYITAVEKLQVAFELGTMSENEIKEEAKSVEMAQSECREVANRIDEVKDINLRIYLRRMYNRRVAMAAYSLNQLIKERNFRAAEGIIRRIQYGFKFANTLKYQVL